MTHGYLILTHNNLEPLLLQLQELDDNKSRFFIHVDKKTQGIEESATYKQLQQMERVTFLEKRVDSQWGSIRGVEATLLLLEEAIKYPELEYLHLLSGQCFPVKSRDYINDYLHRHYGKQFMNYIPMPVKNAEGWGIKRMTLYHFHEYFDPRSKRLRDRLIKLGNGVFRSLQKRVNIINRKFPSRFPPVVYVGSAWWSISLDCAAFFVQYVKEHPEVYRRFYFTQLSDEIFFQTILLNSPFKEKVANNNVRFLKFQPNSPHASEVGPEDIPECMKEDVLFARKFNHQNMDLWKEIMQRQSDMKYTS